MRLFCLLKDKRMFYGILGYRKRGRHCHLDQVLKNINPYLNLKSLTQKYFNIKSERNFAFFITMNIKWSKVNFIAAIVGARVSMGFFSNITSPTLQTLAQNCNVSIATVSWIFTVRS